MKVRNKIKVAVTVLACMLCFSCTNMFATEIIEMRGIDSGNYIEFTVPEDYSTYDITQSLVERVTSIYGEYAGTNEIVAEGNLLSVRGVGDNTGTTVNITLRVKGLLNLYYEVSGSTVTLTCDGELHTLYNSFNIQAGKTYRFYYENVNEDYTVAPNVSLAIVIWDL